MIVTPHYSLEYTTYIVFFFSLSPYAYTYSISNHISFAQPTNQKIILKLLIVQDSFLLTDNVRK